MASRSPGSKLPSAASPRPASRRRPAGGVLGRVGIAAGQAGSRLRRGRGASSNIGPNGGKRARRCRLSGRCPAPTRPCERRSISASSTRPATSPGWSSTSATSGAHCCSISARSTRSRRACCCARRTRSSAHPHGPLRRLRPPARARPRPRAPAGAVGRPGLRRPGRAQAARLHLERRPPLRGADGDRGARARARRHARHARFDSARRFARSDARRDAVPTLPTAARRPPDDVLLDEPLFACAPASSTTRCRCSRSRSTRRRRCGSPPIGSPRWDCHRRRGCAR